MQFATVTRQQIQRAGDEQSAPSWWPRTATMLTDLLAQRLAAAHRGEGRGRGTP